MERHFRHLVSKSLNGQLIKLVEIEQEKRVVRIDGNGVMHPLTAEELFKLIK